jgi:acyl dehydratase
VLGEPTTRGSASKSRLVHSLVAQNDAVESENKIHDDAVARKFGFEGGLVPGVTVFGYLTWPAVSEWGRAWLESGTITARFAAPVYDGDQVEVVGEWQGGELQITACTGGGQRATAAAGMPDRVSEPLALVDFPNDPIPSPDERPPATPEVLGAITLGVVERTWRADLAGDYLALVSDDLAVYRDPPVAHPGWLLRAANYVLSRSVRLGPWIHVESEVRNHSVVTDGEVVATRGRVVDLFDRGGHRFVALDVLTSVGDRPVTSVRHTAIYEPRQVRSPQD